MRPALCSYVQSDRSAAAVIAAAVVAATAAAAHVPAAATAAQDDDEDDDPQAAAAAPAGTVITAPHNEVPPEIKWRPAAGACPGGLSCAASLHTMPRLLIGAAPLRRLARAKSEPPAAAGGSAYAIRSVATLERT